MRPGFSIGVTPAAQRSVSTAPRTKAPCFLSASIRVIRVERSPGYGHPPADARSTRFGDAGFLTRMARITQIARIERRLESAFVGTIRHIRVKTLIEPGFKYAFIRAIGAIRVERFFGSGDEAEAGRMGFGNAGILTQMTQMTRITLIARIKPEFLSAFIRTIRRIRVRKLRLI